MPHNRGTPRRIQNMGFVNGDEKNGLWMTLNGGQLALAPPGSDLSADTPNFESSKINSGGYGIIDLSWRTADEARDRSRRRAASFPSRRPLARPSPARSSVARSLV